MLIELDLSKQKVEGLVRKIDMGDFNGNIDEKIPQMETKITRKPKFCKIPAVVTMAAGDLLSKDSECWDDESGSYKYGFTDKEIPSRSMISRIGFDRLIILPMRMSEQQGAYLISNEVRRRFQTIPQEAQNYYWFRDEFVAMSDLSIDDTDSVK